MYATRHGSSFFSVGICGLTLIFTLDIESEHPEEELVGQAFLGYMDRQVLHVDPDRACYVEAMRKYFNIKEVVEAYPFQVPLQYLGDDNRRA